MQFCPQKAEEPGLQGALRGYLQDVKEQFFFKQEKILKYDCLVWKAGKNYDSKLFVDFEHYLGTKVPISQDIQGFYFGGKVLVGKAIGLRIDEFSLEDITMESVYHRVCIT